MSSIRNGLFYSIWPVLGKRMNFQWGNVRQNTSEDKAVVRSTVLDVEDGEDILNARKDVAGRELGEADFQRRWRTFYDKDEDRWKLQRNSGTQAVPVWEDVLEFDDADGSGDHTGGGFTFSGTVFADGFSSDSFYGITHPEILYRVAEYPTPGGTEALHVQNLLFNDRHFYITYGGGALEGEPLINLLNKDFGKAQVFSGT